MNINFALILFALALFLLWFSNRQRSQLGVPQGRLLYVDMTSEGKLRRPLYDAELDLVGRPDYLIEEEGQLVPIEVKSGRSPKKPYDSHIFQLAAYCLLVARIYGRRPKHGLIRYPNRSFKINFTPQLEADLHLLLEDMRSDVNSPNRDRSHQQSARCNACGYLQICDQSL
jgi:CRISPR-associated exonuclease Cas4